EQSQRSDEREPLDPFRPNCSHFGRKRGAHRTADEIGTLKPRLVDQRADGKHPVEMTVEHSVPAVAARKTRQGRHYYASGLGQPVEKRHPSRQSAVAGQETDDGSPTLAPNARGKAVDVDSRRFRFGHATRSIRGPNAMAPMLTRLRPLE